MRALLLLAAGFVLAGPCAAQPPRAPAPYLQAKPQDLRWWQEARFGMFVHWGPVSLLGTEIGWSRGGERRGIGGTGEVPVEVYDNLYKRFNPTAFDARRWVAIAKAAGMRYLIFTTKHHDGFVEWGSRLTDYTITNSPFGRDVVAELAKACHAAGLRLGFYYSPPDFHHPDFRSPNQDRYVAYMHGQIRELLSNYGRVDILWFDGLNGTAQEWRTEPLLQMVRRLQPHILVNNRAGLPADFDTPEQTVGSFQTSRPWESCITIGDQWAWKPNDRVKSAKECLQTLIRCASGDGNLLFNVGPMPTGEIERRQVERLEEMGRWLKRYGRTIYGTRGGPFRPRAGFGSTCRGNAVYLHVFDWSAGAVALPRLDRRIVSSRVLTGGAARIDQTADGIAVSVPATARQEVDTIVELTLDGPAFTAREKREPSVAQGCRATASNVFAGMPDFGADRAFDGSPDTRWATDAGTRQAWLEVDLGRETTVDHAFIGEAYAGRVQEYAIEVKRGDRWEVVANGTRIGDTLEVRFGPVVARQVRLNILRADEGPTIWEFQLYRPRAR